MRPSLLVAGATVVGVAIFVLRSRRRKANTVKARVSYTRKPDPGRVAGRLVDKELWSRLVSAFAEQSIDEKGKALLQDATWR